MDSRQGGPAGPRHPAQIGLLLALALWALLVVAGSAVALAADSQAPVPADSLAAAPADAAATVPIAAVPADSIAAVPADAPSALVANDKAASAGGAAAQPAAPMPADAATQPAVAEEPFDPDSVLGPEPPTRVRVAILNATGKPGGANKVAVLLGEYKRQALEDQIGLQIEVVNLSAADNVRPGQSILFYRPEFLRAALAMAKAIPGEQFVEPMRPAGLKRMGVDVEIVVGKELP